HDVDFRIGPRGVELRDLDLPADQHSGRFREVGDGDLGGGPERVSPRPVERPNSIEQLRPAVDLVPDILPGPDLDGESALRDLSRSLLDPLVPRARRGNEETAQRGKEPARFADLLFELRHGELRAQQSTFLLALDAHPTAAVPPEDVDSGLLLTGAAVLLRARISPDLLPEIQAERFEGDRIARRGPGFDVGGHHAVLLETAQSV